jgi:hypothetical protein
MASEFTEERAIWLYRHYLWLERHLPRRPATAQARLILPTKEYFPHRYAADHASAEAVFQRIRELMGMTDWRCDFAQRSSPADEVGRRGGLMGRSSSSGAAGTYASSAEKEPTITYSASLLKNPEGLVATIAHEMCHYLLARVQEEPPGAWKELEPLTDLSAVVEGFGVFLCNSAFQFEQWTGHDGQGWSFRRTGYLTEAELGFSLAISCVRNRLDAKLAERALKPNPRQVFRDALDYVADLEEEGKRA